MPTKSSFFRLKFPDVVFIILLIVSGVLLGFSSGGFIINFKELGFTVLSQMQSGVHVVSNSVGKGFSAIKHIAQLQEENKMLTEKLHNYEQLQRSNAEIRKENERLKEQLDYSVSLSQKNIVAQIVGRSVDNLYSSITINKGAKHGIKKNMGVIAIQDGREGLVGKIVTVGRNTSIIMPVYDEKCNVSARIQNTRDLGLVTGVGSSDIPLEMKYIKKRVADDLHYGDMIVTSGENDNYMKDMPIGFIETVAVLDYEATLFISVTPIVDFSRLENVVVVDLHNINDKE